MTVLIPVPFTVTHFRCPVSQCGRTGSSKARIADHIARCWLNPDARACKTCAHYRPDTSEGDVGYLSPEYCDAGLPFPEDALGRPTLAVDCPQWKPTKPVAAAVAGRLCGQVHDGQVCTKPRVHDTNGCWGHYGPEVDPDARWVCTVDLHTAGAERCRHCQPIPGRPQPGGES